jgi:hypothetical protein
MLKYDSGSERGVGRGSSAHRSGLTMLAIRTVASVLDNRHFLFLRDANQNSWTYNIINPDPD